MKLLVLRISLVPVLLLCGGLLAPSYGQWSEAVENTINHTLEKGETPGLSVVIVSKDRQWIKTYGHADIERNTPVTEQTLFQLGSCSKAFTALAISHLARQGRVDLNDNVSEYIPWFRMQRKGKDVEIKVNQLLHHTGGIPWNTIAMIPASNESDALEQTVRTLIGVELFAAPGEEFQYATINYDVLALIIEKVTGEPFETYMDREIFSPLGLDQTSIGKAKDSSQVASGYKIGFRKARRYQAPVYRGNNAAGYVTTNITDMAQWLRFQMALDSSALSKDISQTHQRDETVPPVGNASYAMGWQKSLNGDHLVFHNGLNPNYTAFVGFNENEKYGVVLLANSNTAYTHALGRNILRILGGKKVVFDAMSEDNNDRAYSTVAIVLAGFVTLVLAFIGYTFFRIRNGQRVREGFTKLKSAEAVIPIVFSIPFLYGLYELPSAMQGFTWEATLVWAPISFYVMIILAVAAVAISYIAHVLTLCFPEKDRHIGALPRLVLVSALSGVSNLALILLITTSLRSNVDLKFQIFYFGLILSVYLLGRRFVQIRLIKLTRDLIYDMRIKLLERIFNTSYQKFEKIDRGKIYTAFNDDVGTIADSMNMFIMLVTNLFTTIAAVTYLATVAFWATILTVTLVATLCTLYYFVGRSTHHLFEEARDTRNVFMRLLNGMIDGYKEISLHINKKISYRYDVAHTADEYRRKMSTASIRFVKASLLGETVLIVILGTTAFAFPILFPDIPAYAISMFIVVLLYLIGPVNGILQAVPSIKRLHIAWKRVQQFMAEIPANCNNDFTKVVPRTGTVSSLRAQGLSFKYNEGGEHNFEVGPINLEVNRGEVLFIIGGNGSGKTTLAKLLTGLYQPTEGSVFIDEKEVHQSRLGESFSAVFNPLYLFEKLYNINTSEKYADIEKYLDVLDLKEKVEVLDNGTFSTINLSGGQRKRLALLLCFLEDSPIYLFDEWAADQDPEYRRFFYRTLIPEMKAKGKIVIAITHDDHYFDVADRVVKMNQGKLELFYPEHQRLHEIDILK